MQLKKLHMCLTSQHEKPNKFKPSPLDLGHEQFEEPWLLAQYPDLWEKIYYDISHPLLFMKLKIKIRDAKQNKR